MAIPNGITLLLCLLSIIPNHWPNLAKAETLLTEKNQKGDDVENQQEDEHGHPMRNKWTPVNGYNQLNQCMRQPGVPHIMSYAIALRMGPNVFNGGIGTIICYSGQLDKLNHYNGMVASAPFRLSNIRGNPVAKMCQYFRKMCNDTEEEKANMMGCPTKTSEFLASPWHGIQLRQKESDMNILQIKLSTTNQSFEIPLRNLTEDLLVLKLTRYNSFVNMLSTKFGPGYHAEKMYTENLEEHGLINQQLDQKLLQTYLTNISQGSTVQKYVAPWALAVDILPSTADADDVPINFFVIRSNCSEVEASFLFPTDIASNKLILLDKKPLKKRWDTTSLKENHGIMIWGRIPDKPEKFTIRLINTQIETDDYGIGVLVTFNGPEAKYIFQNSTGYGVWIEMTPNFVGKMEKNSLEFRAGELVVLKLVSLKSSFKLSLNCGPYTEINRGWELRAGNRFKIEVDGNFEVFKIKSSAPVDNTLNNTIDTQHERILSPGQGYLLRANLLPDWETITIKFFAEEENKQIPLIAFVASKLDNEVNANWYVKDWVMDPIVETTNATIREIEGWSPKGGAWFELHFVFASLTIAKLDECIAGCAAAKAHSDDKLKDCIKKEKCYIKKELCLRACDPGEESCIEDCENTYNMCEGRCKKRVNENCKDNCNATQQNINVRVIQFYLNDRPIYDHPLDEDAEIHQITIVADANDTNKVEKFTENPPAIHKLDIDTTERSLKYILQGKVPMNAYHFTIHFLYFKDVNLANLTLQNSKCFRKSKSKASICQSFLRIGTSFTKQTTGINSTTTFASFLYREGKKAWVDRGNKSDFFAQGADFILDVAWKLKIKNGEFPVSVNVQTVSKKTKFDFEMPDCQDCVDYAPNHIQIMGNIILFDKPTVEGASKPNDPAPHDDPFEDKIMPHLKLMGKNTTENV